jgi:uncharacterized protein YebE (UPF0316 family)
MAILLLCLQIFFFRIIDVSLGVMRTIMTVKRKPLFASFIGFIEVLIWFTIVRNAITTEVDGIFVALAFALGFATGTYIGGFLSKQFISTKISVQIITSMRDELLLKAIRASGFPATVLEASGSGEDKCQRYLIFVEIENKNFNKLKQLVLQIDPRAFLSVHELTSTINGFFVKRK